MADEMVEFTRVAATSLGVPYEHPWPVPPETTLCAFEDGKLATTYMSHPFTIRFNGGDALVAGIAAVGTLPVYRRLGYLRRIVKLHFERLYEAGERPMAILWPSQGAIYQRYGYAFVSAHRRYQVKREDLAFCGPALATGRLEEAGMDALVGVYDEFSRGRTGSIRREEGLWRNDVLKPPPAGGVLCCVACREGGRPLGYLVYTIESTGPGHPDQRVTIRELAHLTMPAYRALWDYLATMDLVGTISWPNLPQDDPLPHLLLDPRRLGAGVRDGIMARLVDVAKVLALRRYATPARLTFRLVDEFCPWNDGTWLLETEAGAGAVTRTGETPRVTMPPGTLAKLVFGRMSASEAARAGLLDAADPQILDAWDTALRTRHPPFCADHF